MAPLTLGNTPLSLEVRLTADADFVTGMDSMDGDWPDSAEATLRFATDPVTEWTGVTFGPSIDWDVDKAEVNALILARPPSVQLRYVDGTTDITWALGRVLIFGVPS